MQGHMVHYTNLVIKDAEQKDLHAVMPQIDELCWLLSFACCSEIAAPIFLRESGEMLSGRSCHPGYYYFRPVLDPSDGSALMRLIQMTWPAFQTLKVRRRLPVALDYFVRSQYLGKTRELGMIVTFVLLEHLKHSFAEDTGYIWQGAAWFDHTVSPPQSRGFKSLLNAMFVAVGMNKPDAELERVKKLRNEIIHSGLSQLSAKEQEEIFDLAQNLCREYLLRLLGFTGSYSPYAAGSQVATI
jgi:hypothetical protein